MDRGPEIDGEGHHEQRIERASGEGRGGKSRERSAGRERAGQDSGRGGSRARPRAGLRDGSVPADADGGRLHDIADETSVVAPARIEALAAGWSGCLRSPPVPGALVPAGARATNRAPGHRDGP